MTYRCGFVALVGRPNVGKSTLMNHFIGKKISITSKKAQTTRHRICGILTQDSAQIIFVDTPGFQTQHRNALNDRLNLSVKQSLAEVDCILLLIEALRWTSADAALLPLLPPSTPVILVINKDDKLKNTASRLPFSTEVSACYPFAAIHWVSAKHSRALTPLVNTLQEALPFSVPLYPETSLTDRNESFLAHEIVREKLFRYLGQELPYALHVVIESFEKSDELCRIHGHIFVNKVAQKSMVIGKEGEKLKKIATEARLDMEKCFASKVFLHLWVKVKSGWVDDIQTLNKFGF